MPAMLHRLRHKLSSLNPRARQVDRKSQKPLPEDDVVIQQQDEPHNDDDELSTPALTTSATLDDSPAAPSPELPSPPILRLTTTATVSSSSPPTPVTPSSSKRELPWRERRLTAQPVPASIVHAYTPPPTPPKPKLTTLPPELLHSIFLYLRGDPTRPDNVAYRSSEAGQDDPARWYSHAWSLMQVARTCAYLRAVAAPLLYSQAALITKDDFGRLAMASAGLRGRIRHLTVSITALEHLYVYLTILHLAHTSPSSPSSPSVAFTFPAIHLHPHSNGKKPTLRGSPFHALLPASHQLTRLTLFRPRGEPTQTGDAVLRGFTAFFLLDVLGYFKGLEVLELSDPRGEWHVPLGEEVEVEVDVARLRRLMWDVALPPPSSSSLRNAKVLNALYLGAHVPPHSALHLPTTLQTLHILTPTPSSILLDRLPALVNLHDLRISLPAITASSNLDLPPSLQILHLDVPALPNIPALARAVSHLRALRILLLSMPGNPAAVVEPRGDRPRRVGWWTPPAAGAAGSGAAGAGEGSGAAPESKSPSPEQTACETLAPHIAHRALAKRVMASARGVAEVRVGGCVWGRVGGADVWAGGGGRRRAEEVGGEAEAEVEVAWVRRRARMVLPAVWD